MSTPKECSDGASYNGINGMGNRYSATKTGLTESCNNAAICVLKLIRGDFRAGKAASIRTTCRRCGDEMDIERVQSRSSRKKQRPSS